jgi:hypothetical protein
MTENLKAEVLREVLTAAGIADLPKSFREHLAKRIRHYTELYLLREEREERAASLTPAPAAPEGERHEYEHDMFVIGCAKCRKPALDPIHNKPYGPTPPAAAPREEGPTTVEEYLDVVEGHPELRKVLLEIGNTVALPQELWDRLCDEVCKALRKAAHAQGRAEGVVLPRPLSEWHEDYGPMLWWFFPVEEPPYAGTPLDSDWPGYHTHWTPIPIPHLTQQKAS